MSPLHRLVMTLAALVAAAVVAVGLAPAASAATSSASQPCSSVRQIGDRKVVSDLGMSAFTVRQYIGWCSDSRGSAWMNFASVYVWDQYHARGFAYRSYSGVAVRGEPETRGFTSSANRQQAVLDAGAHDLALHAGLGQGSTAPARSRPRASRRSSAERPDGRSTPPRRAQPFSGGFACRPVASEPALCTPAYAVTCLPAQPLSR